MNDFTTLEEQLRPVRTYIFGSLEITALVIIKSTEPAPILLANLPFSALLYGGERDMQLRAINARNKPSNLGLSIHEWSAVGGASRRNRELERMRCNMNAGA